MADGLGNCQEKDGIAGMLKAMPEDLRPGLFFQLNRITDEADAVAGRDLSMADKPDADAGGEQHENQNKVKIVPPAWARGRDRRGGPVLDLDPLHRRASLPTLSLVI